MTTLDKIKDAYLAIHGEAGRSQNGESAQRHLAEFWQRIEPLLKEAERELKVWQKEALQQYPTPEAYDAACAALHRHENAEKDAVTKLQAAEAACAEMKSLLDWSETLILSAKPPELCSSEEWSAIQTKWQEQKHSVNLGTDTGWHSQVAWNVFQSTLKQLNEIESAFYEIHNILCVPRSEVAATVRQMKSRIAELERDILEKQLLFEAENRANAELHHDVIALKKIFPKILAELQCGTCSPDSSIDYLEEIPKEVGLVVGELKAKLHIAEKLFHHATAEWTEEKKRAAEAEAERGEMRAADVEDILSMITISADWHSPEEWALSQATLEQRTAEANTAAGLAEALQKQLSELQKKHDDTLAGYIIIEKGLRESLEAARKDSERMDWIDHEGIAIAPQCNGGWVIEREDRGYDDASIVELARTRGSLREAIDSAMSAKGEA